MAVGILALASRLFPDLTGPREVSRLLPGTEARLSYPVYYLNGLGMLMALGVPLALRTATSIEAGRWRAAALAPVPALVGVVYLTSSRGAAAVGAVGVLAFVALTDRRLLTRGRARWLPAAPRSRLPSCTPARRSYSARFAPIWPTPRVARRPC